MTRTLAAIATLFFLQIAVVATAQTAIEGRVVDAETKDPIPYAMLFIAGTHTGTQTNLDGAYSLKMADKNADGKVVVGYAGYCTDTIPLRQLRRHSTVKLRPLRISLQTVQIDEYKKPSSLLKEVVRRIPDNYWTDTAVGTFFFRRYSLTSDSLWLFCEALADVMRPGYDKQYYMKRSLLEVDITDARDSVNLAGNHKRFTTNRMLVYDTAMLKRMMGDSIYANNPFAGRSQTEYDDVRAFNDILQSTEGSFWFSGKRTRKLDKRSSLTLYDDEKGNSYYLITRVTDRDSTALLINHRDKALLHYYHTSLRADTVRLPFPFNRILGGVWSPYSRAQYDYAKVGDRYTLVFSMQASAYGILEPKRSLVGGKINREIRRIITDDVVEDYRVWTLLDMHPSDYRFLDSTLPLQHGKDRFYHELFGADSGTDSLWQQYSTVPIEARIEAKLDEALSRKQE